MTKLYCDLCGKQILPNEQDREIKAKVKEKKWFEGYYGWVKIEAHARCVKNLLTGMELAEKVRADVTRAGWYENYNKEDE